MRRRSRKSWSASWRKVRSVNEEGFDREAEPLFCMGAEMLIHAAWRRARFPGKAILCVLCYAS